MAEGALRQAPAEGFCSAVKSAEVVISTVTSATEAVPSTMVFYESPKRLASSLKDMIAIYGAERAVSVCRELTKKFEEVMRGSLQGVLEQIEARESIKGEVVVVLGPPMVKEASEEDIEGALRAALQKMRVKDAASEVATQFGLPRKEVYARALALNKS